MTLLTLDRATKGAQKFSLCPHVKTFCATIVFRAGVVLYRERICHFLKETRHLLLFSMANLPLATDTVLKMLLWAD